MIINCMEFQKIRRSLSSMKFLPWRRRIINFIRKVIAIILLIFLVILTTEAVASHDDPVSEEDTVISTIEGYFNDAKKSFFEKDLFTAIVKFNRVIELEKDFYTIYTPYAEEYIKRAKEEMKKEEERNLEGKEVYRAEEDKSSPISQESQKEYIEKDEEAVEYTISEGDVLYIHVWQEDNLSHDVIVHPDGMISFPLAGDVPAAGLTFTQFKKGLTERLKQYIKYPQLSISLKKIGGKKVIVLGEVNQPGVYNVSGESGILELISRAGGFTQDAVYSSAILIRGGLQNPKGKRLNLSRAIKKADASQNIVVQPEDIIYVPKKFIAKVHYVVGRIMGPISQGVYTTKTVSDW